MILYKDYLILRFVVKGWAGSGQRIPISGVMFAVLLLAQGLILTPAEGETLTDSPVIERMEVRFSSFSHAVLNASLTIHEYQNGSTPIPADALRQRLTAPGQEAFRTEIGNKARLILRKPD